VGAVLPPFRSHPPALGKALEFHETFPRWKQLCVTVQWNLLGNWTFLYAAIFYLFAAVENLRLSYYEVMIPADYQDYFFFDQINWIGAILYTIEPCFDLLACWSSAIFATQEQAWWEHTQQLHLVPRSGTHSEAAIAASAQQAQQAQQAGGAAVAQSFVNPVSAAAATAAVTGSDGGGLGAEAAPAAAAAASEPPAPAAAATAPAAEEETAATMPSRLQRPWYTRWIDDGQPGPAWHGAPPSVTQLILRDLNFWAAMYFLLASVGYLWYSTVPFMFWSFCQDTECGYCGYHHQSREFETLMHLARECDPATDLTASSLLNGSGGFLLPGTVSRYAEMGNVGGWGLVFDAVVGLLAWFSVRRLLRPLRRPF
jgi:hypothetical protein